MTTIDPTPYRVPGPPAIALDRAGRGPLALFMHGIGGNRTNWRAQLPAFAPHFACAAWDARGYGASDDYDGPLAFDELQPFFGIETRHAHQAAPRDESEVREEKGRVMIERTRIEDRAAARHADEIDQLIDLGREAGRRASSS